MKKKQEKIIIYQLLVRLAGNTVRKNKPWGSIRENGCGKFNDLSERFLEEIAGLGASHIWLTGIPEHASCTAYPDQEIPADNPLVVKGRAGSPYAIRDYYDVCPDLATDVDRRMEEFEALIGRCHSSGLTPLIDFVPNHLARRYHSDHAEGVNRQFGRHDNTSVAFSTDNNFYYLPGQALKLPEEVYQHPTSREVFPAGYEENPAKATGNDCFSAAPSYSDWYETVKLNYGIDYRGKNPSRSGIIPDTLIPDTWSKMLDILLFWAGKNIGGFRCDMAEMVPPSFWEWAIGKIREQYPAILFIAEIYNPAAYNTYSKAGFDYLYDKAGFYDCIRDIIAEKKEAGALTGVWKSLVGSEGAMLRFVENHDEQRIASSHFAGNANAGIPATVAAACMHQGPLMIYFGQELGEEARGISGFSRDDGRTSIFDYCSVPAFRQWFSNGKCTSGNLPAEAARLRESYKKFLMLCRHPVISNGNFYDLMWANPVADKHLYAFIRWDARHTWIIALNFSGSDNISARIRIPDHFMTISGRKDPASWTCHPLFNEGTPCRIISKKNTESGLALILQPFSAEIISIKSICQE